MKTPKVTGKRASSSALKGSTPSELSSLVTTMAKHSESRPESNSARSSVKGRSRLSCSWATRLNWAITSDLTSIPRLTDLPRRNGYPRAPFVVLHSHSDRREHSKAERHAHSPPNRPEGNTCRANSGYAAGPPPGPRGLRRNDRCPQPI